MSPLEWIQLQFQNSSTINDKNVFSEFDQGLAQQVILILNHLVTQGVVARSTIRGEAMYSVADSGAIEALWTNIQDISIRTIPGVPPKSVAQAQRQDLETDALVVTTPLSMTGKLRSLLLQYPTIRVHEMKYAFGDLLKGTQNEIFLSVPFLELDGLMTFVDEFRSLGKKNAVIKALTRELIVPARYDYSYYQKLRAFAKLIDLFVAGGGEPRNVEIRDYTIKIGNLGDKGLVYEGIHQKMIVSDRHRAYIGSGEIRASSFIVNGDVGVIQSGQAASFWADYFLMFWSEAQLVQHSFFQSALSST